MTDRIVSKRRRALMIAPVVFGLALQVKAQARGIVMLVQMNGLNIDVDRAAAAHLQAHGHEVRLVDQSTPQHAIGTPELVIVSSTVSSKDVAPGWRTLAVPMLTWENDLLDDFAMTGKRHDVDFSEAAKEGYLVARECAACALRRVERGRDERVSQTGGHELGGNRDWARASSRRSTASRRKPRFSRTKRARRWTMNRSHPRDA